MRPTTPNSRRPRGRRAVAYRPGLEPLDARSLLSVAVGGPIPSSRIPSVAAPRLVTPGDFDGTGTTDLAVYRPATAQWVIRRADGSTALTRFGDPSKGDVAVPGDYDGDGT